MNCERCHLKIENESDHGWMICELLPRDTFDVPGRWTRHANVEREFYAADILQPIKKGKVNPDFIKVHGTKELQKQWKMSDREIREHAK